MDYSHMDYSHKDIIGKLEGYNELKRKALQLSFELEHYRPNVTGYDIIEAMTFNQGLGECVSGGLVSDKTANISVSYDERAAHMNIRHKQDLESEHAEVTLELRRLEYYINILEQKYSDILRLLYLEGKTYVTTAAEMKISVATVPNNRAKAIEKLTEMYNRIVTK